jgi:hypothetical protein
MQERGAPMEVVVGVVSDLWGIVDSAHRIRVLIVRMPLFPKNDPRVRTFLDATSNAEDLRHYVQHLNNEIRSLGATSPPLWGSISWVSESDPLASFTLATGSHHLAQSLPGLVFDREEGKFVRNCELTAGKSKIDIDDLCRRVADLNEVVSMWANSITFGNGERYAYDSTYVPMFHAAVRRARDEEELRALLQELTPKRA